MTCREIMTQNPTCCVPSDTAARAAQIMKTDDVGPVPIVDNYGNNLLVGIVTDRDLALKVVAEGKDPSSMRLENIMSRSLVTCSPDDDIHDAMRKMSDNQVRRIPIVDNERRLIGIIAQADVARHASEQQVGGVVEDISSPGGLRSRVFSGGFRQRNWGDYEENAGRGGSGLLTAVIGLGIGAGLMFLMDPRSGRKRRTAAKDKAVSSFRSAAGEVNRRARGLVGSEQRMAADQPGQGAEALPL